MIIHFVRLVFNLKFYFKIENFVLINQNIKILYFNLKVKVFVENDNFPIRVWCVLVQQILIKIFTKYKKSKFVFSFAFYKNIDSKNKF